MGRMRELLLGPCQKQSKMADFVADAQTTKDSIRTRKIDQLEEAAKLALFAIEGWPKGEGTLNTPKRWAKMMADLTQGPEFALTSFDAAGYNEMVVQTGINFFSLCEHHLVPFFGTAVVGYIPRKRIVGISKLSRTVEHFSKKLQVQERMTLEIAQFLEKNLKPDGVAVVLRARHLCQEMRGIKKVGAETVTSCLRGVFMKDGPARNEFLSLARA